ncbi:cilia- and flagella-associated protein 97 [Leuresthes tenuis]|uniref:cilia- and flagella-associated protein 97 n=1 Tax=Leuresthes tenuis TaxID=355514 RepID=UPI003B51274D
MFNPDELEGEVDHSFFDSDCEGISGDAGKNKEKGLSKKKSPAAHERLPATHNKNVNNDLSSNTERTGKHLKQVENNKRSRAPDVSSVSCTSDQVISDSSDGQDDSIVHKKRPSGGFMALLANTQDGDYVYGLSPNEMGDTALAFSASSKRKNEQSPRKQAKSRYHCTPSPTSNEASADADSESSCSSRRSNLGSPTHPKPNKSSYKKTRVGSAGSRDFPTSSTDESDDSVTDVSPLSSPESSPLQSLDLNNTEVEDGNHDEQQQQGSVPSSGLSTMKQEEDSDQDLDERSLSLESQLGSKLVFPDPGGRNRKNYSFTNDEVRRIDRENQRLLRELSRLSPGPRPGSAVGMKTHVAGSSPLIRFSHSALNRKREQQRIERENLAFLKRLESVKPTPGLKRSEQLSDYQRQVGYLGAPSYPICKSTTTKERVSSRTSSASTGLRPVSSKADFTNADSSLTPVPSSSKLNAARPAWC